jgi:prephenate dehydrogenase
VRLAVLGLGLIGGSVGLAARERLGAEVIGWDPSPDALASALQRGAVQQSAAGPQDAVAGAEAVFAAAPVGQLPKIVAEALEHAGADCVVTDVGSVKRAIVSAVDDPRFVGGHPLAGAETSGVEHARADLFAGATWYLTPTERTSGLLYERLHRVVLGLGARPCAIDPATHDRTLATVSHLPHVLANVLVCQAAGMLGEEGEALPATGPSFRDATRVAGAPTAIWGDIYLSNRDALAAALSEAITQLEVVRDGLLAGDRDSIIAWNERAADHRRRLAQSPLSGGAVVELRASVPNRPGVIAQLALELGRAGVNISDLALYPAPDMSEGVVALWVAGQAEAERATALIAGLGFPVARA